MKIKLESLLKKYERISELLNDETIDNISLKYQLLTILHSLEYHKVNANKLRNELIKRYGNLDENGTYYLKESDDNYESYIEEMQNLLETEISLSDITKLKFKDVINVFKQEDLLCLYEFIDGDF